MLYSFSFFLSGLKNSNHFGCFCLECSEMVADDSVMSDECKPDDVEKTDNMEDGR